MSFADLVRKPQKRTRLLEHNVFWKLFPDPAYEVEMKQLYREQRSAWEVAGGHQSGLKQPLYVNARRKVLMDKLEANVEAKAAVQAEMDSKREAAAAADASLALNPATKTPEECARY